MALPAWAVAAIPSVIGGVAGMFGQGQANRANRREAQRNRNFQERMRNTQWQSTVEDMKSAGINPAVAYSQGPNASPGGSQAAPQGNVVSSALQAARFKKELELLDGQVDQQRADAKAAKSNANVAAVNEWFEKERKNFYSGPMTLEYQVGGKPVNISYGSTAGKLYETQLNEMFARTRSAQAQADLYGASAGVANRLSNAFMGPFGSLTGLAGQGWNSISSGRGYRDARQTLDAWVEAMKARARAFNAADRRRSWIRR